MSKLASFCSFGSLITTRAAVGSLVVRASDSRSEGLGSIPDATKYPRSTCSLNQWVRNSFGLNHECREWRIFFSRSAPCLNCGSGDRPTSGVLLAPCQDEFRGPRSDYVRQNDLHEWARDHRVHHKFAETNADPHNVNRGFFFAHMGWLMAKKQKDVIEKGKTVDVSDVWADPVVRFQHRFYVPLCALCCFIIPAAIPYYCWNENFLVCFFGAGFFRYVVCLHFTWFVNSAAHMWGNKPYDKNISAVETKWVSALAIGEGFHNYHHTFPWDYSTSELGYKYNFTTFFIDCMAYIGQAYDLKTASKESVEQRKLRTGDGSYSMEEKMHKE
ncbi:stearoyl-CoA desaturase 5 [Trichonephila clavipes]|nr:stearoyl-CoA desaturase 5 [Trichonephila clavipes]